MLTPETLNPVLLVVICEIDALAPPVFWIVSVWAWLLPVWTSVKVKFTGIAANLAPVAPDVPVPDRATSTVVLEPLIVIDRMPSLAPVLAGVNMTPKVVL